MADLPTIQELSQRTTKLSGVERARGTEENHGNDEEQQRHDDIPDDDDDDCNVEAAGAKPACDDKAESLMFCFPFFSAIYRAPLRDC
jgi:hypothetical protein